MSSWRTTSIGAVMEAMEQHLILGDVKGAQVFDVGCGDGVLACAAASRGARATGNAACRPRPTRSNSPGSSRGEGWEG